MQLPEKNLDTPFNVTRSSHVVLTVKDLDASRLFYTEVVGLMVSEETGGALYLRTTPLGRAWLAIRENTERASFIGVNTGALKLIAYVFSAGLASLAGALFVLFNGAVSPDVLHWFESGKILMYVVLGGVGTIVGPVFGAALFTFLEHYVSSYTDAWLNLRDINFTTPDQQLFPKFDPFLQFAMLQETRGYWRELVEDNLSVTNLVKSDFAMLNNRLAEHYGIDGVAGPQLREVKLPADSIRGGLLSQASILKVSANGTNTSPVVRGVYVMERLLGQAPPPPPPG